MGEMTCLHPSICVLPPSPKCNGDIINFTFRTSFLIFHQVFRSLELPSFGVTMTLTLHAQTKPISFTKNLHVY